MERRNFLSAFFASVIGCLAGLFTTRPSEALDLPVLNGTDDVLDIFKSIRGGESVVKVTDIVICSHSYIQPDSDCCGCLVGDIREPRCNECGQFFSLSPEILWVQQQLPEGFKFNVGDAYLEDRGDLGVDWIRKGRRNEPDQRIFAFNQASELAVQEYLNMKYPEQSFSPNVLLGLRGKSHLRMVDENGMMV